MQPYQKATENIRSGNEYPVQLLKNLGLSAAGGGAAKLGYNATSKLIPVIGSLINKFIPENLSKAGLSKVDSRFGKFIDGAINEGGYSYDEIRKFLEEKLEKEKPPKQSGNIIEQYSPELHKYISEEVQKGRQPIEAGALAQLQDRFKKIIKKITEDHQTTFQSILDTTYGGGQYGGNVNQPSQSQQQQSPENGVDAQLLAALDKILKM